LKIAALFSGGKNSVYSLYLVQQAGLEVEFLVTAYAQRDSRMYHVTSVGISELAAQALGIPQAKFTTAGKDEVTPLRDVLNGLDIEGLCFGAVDSNYQRNRVVKVCLELGIQPIAPLWHKDPVALLGQMVDLGFEITMVRVAAEGLDESWLGRVLDRDALEEFLRVCDKYRINPAGEGGEYETVVLSGPHMKGRIEVEFEMRWFEASGELEITEARLVDQ
jgi:diphthine-ammonia ligase